MQSSTLLTLRSALMLACMVIVPIVAVCGTNWMKDFGLDGSPSTPNLAPAAPKKVAGGNNPYANMAQSGASGGGRQSGPAAAPRWSGNSGQATSAPGSIPGGLPTQNASFETPLGAAGARSNPVQQAVPQPGSPSETQVAAAGFVAPSVPVPADPRRLVALPPVGPDGAGPQGGLQPITASTDWFTWTQQRLRDLGATYYLLETWGRHGELYRFHCKMAIAGNPDYSRHFEASDSDAAKAMQSVLRQVEAWRSGHEP